MRRRTKLPMIAGLLAIIAFAGGCSFQDGIQKGLTDGISAALSYLIKTPVTVAVDQAVKPPQ